jgi:hypothetical protein
VPIAVNDGAEAELGPGDVVAIRPGHDTWVVGDEACVSIDWGGSANYAETRREAVTAGIRAVGRPVGFANSCGLIFMDESAEEIPAL